jgi:hypothetical protein
MPQYRSTRLRSGRLFGSRQCGRSLRMTVGWEIGGSCSECHSGAALG